MKKYFFLLLTGVFAILLMVSIFNWLINPYDILLSPEIAGVNSYKVEVARHARFSKPYQVERIKPRSILLASSKGMVVPYDYFSEADMTGFNYSLLGATTYESLRMLQHAQALHPLKRVVLALDEEFLANKAMNFSENRLAVNFDGTMNQSRPIQKVQDVFESLLSLNALRSSLRTIRKQKEGPLVVGDDSHQASEVYKVGGHHQMFRNREGSVFLNSKHVYADNCMQSTAEFKDINMDNAAYFEKIVDIAYKNSIDLYIYFAPVHARYYETMCMAGQWWKIENMKRVVIDIVDKKAAKYNKQAYPVWDFSGYNRITTEDLPELGDKEILMKWYWDDSHYTVNTAKLIFDRIFTRNSVAEDFGILVTAENINNHLSKLRREHLVYVENNKKYISELNEILKNNINDLTLNLR